jgi:hypothetical protein
MLNIILALLLQVQPIPDAAPDAFGGPFESLREWMQKRSETEDVRYHGIRSMLEQIRNKPDSDPTVLFPRINAAIDEIREARNETVASVGPIRDAIRMLTQLVYALIILAAVLLGVDVYRTFFRKAA